MEVSSKLVNIIVPCYNEQDCIQLFYEKIKEEFMKIVGYRFEIIFVDDGSRDETLSRIKTLIEQYGSKEIKYISLSRNFGKESAMYVGMTKATGDEK